MWWGWLDMSEQTSTAPFVANANQSNSSPTQPRSKKQVKTKRSKGIRYIVWLAHSHSRGYKMRCCLIFLLSKATDLPSAPQLHVSGSGNHNMNQIQREGRMPPLHHPPVIFFYFWADIYFCLRWTSDSEIWNHTSFSLRGIVVEINQMLLDLNYWWI